MEIYSGISEVFTSISKLLNLTRGKSLREASVSGRKYATRLGSKKIYLTLYEKLESLGTKGVF